MQGEPRIFLEDFLVIYFRPFCFKRIYFLSDVKITLFTLIGTSFAKQHKALAVQGGPYTYPDLPSLFSIGPQFSGMLLSLGRAFRWASGV